MATTTAVLMRIEDRRELIERAAIAGGMAGYSGNTVTSYTTDLRLFTAWCVEHGVRLLEVKRPHLELSARSMGASGRMPATVARRLSTLRGFYRYCHDEGLLTGNPAAHVRRPKVDPESRTLGLDRNELGALLVQVGLGSLRDHALISLLGLNGLRISEARGPTSTTWMSTAGTARCGSSARAASTPSSRWRRAPPAPWMPTSPTGRSGRSSSG
jgi:site-specific recombinase XerD